MRSSFCSFQILCCSYKMGTLSSRCISLLPPPPRLMTSPAITFLNECRREADAASTDAPRSSRSALRLTSPSCWSQRFSKGGMSFYANRHRDIEHVALGAFHSRFQMLGVEGRYYLRPARLLFATPHRCLSRAGEMFCYR